jgi:hypothetical protein
LILPLCFSVVLFVLSYLTIDAGGYIWLAFLVIGVVIALLGIVMTFRE